MSVKVKTVARKNPQDLTAPPKYYAQKVNTGEFTINELIDYISTTSTVSKPDVHAVLYALQDAIPKELGRSNIVRLGNLGSFNITVRSAPSDTEDEVTKSNVKKVNLHFRPSVGLKKMIDSFEIEKIEG